MLDLSGTLRLTIDGQDIDVTADGLALRAEVGRPRRLLRSLGFGLTSLVLARRLARALARYDLTLEVTQRGVPVARLGAGVSGGWVGRVLRIPNLRFHRK